VILRKSFLALLLVLCLFASGCGSDTRETSPLPTPELDPAALLTAVALDPAAYTGKQVIVEGVLESTGDMPDAAFFLGDGQGHKLAASAWAPLEVMKPAQGTEQPKTMAAFVGKRLRLTGLVTQVGEGYLLEVAQAVEK
jgi:hypothetical protein